MRRLAPLLLALLLASCGEAERAAAPQPTVDPAFTTPGTAPLPLGEPARPRAPVPDGQVGVLGLDGEAGVRPRRLAFAEDAELSRVEWSAWGREGAEGQGNLALLECTPSCARGATRRVGAVIRLSDPVECPDGVYFDRAEVTIPGEDPMSFIQAPC